MTGYFRIKAGTQFIPDQLVDRTRRHFFARLRPIFFRSPALKSESVAISTHRSARYSRAPSSPYKSRPKLESTKRCCRQARRHGSPLGTIAASQSRCSTIGFSVFIRHGLLSAAPPTTRSWPAAVSPLAPVDGVPGQAGAFNACRKFANSRKIASLPSFSGSAFSADIAGKHSVNFLEKLCSAAFGLPFSSVVIIEAEALKSRNPIPQS